MLFKFAAVILHIKHIKQCLLVYLCTCAFFLFHATPSLFICHVTLYVLITLLVSSPCTHDESISSEGLPWNIQVICCYFNVLETYKVCNITTIQFHSFWSLMIYNKHLPTLQTKYKAIISHLYRFNYICKQKININHHK